MAEILELEGLTKKIGLEDLNLGNGLASDTYSAPTYAGGTQTLTKIPDPRDTVHSKIKGVWYVSTDLAITDHGNPATPGSLAWVVAEIGAGAGTIILPPNRTYTIGTSLTLNATTNLIVMPYSFLLISVTKTLTINGHLLAMEGGNPIVGTGTFALAGFGYVDRMTSASFNTNVDINADFRVISIYGAADRVLTLVDPGAWGTGKRVLIINLMAAGYKITINGATGGAVNITGYLDTVEYVYQAGSWYQAQRTFYATEGETDNFIINGNMDVWQRGISFTSGTTPANNDDTYLTDRWLLLSDGNNIVNVTRNANDPDYDPAKIGGTRYTMCSTVVTGGKRWGFLQILESSDSRRYSNKTCSARATLRGSGLSKARIAILRWNGTVDAPTSDCVASWGSVGNNPGMIGSWTIVGWSELALSGVYQTITLENVVLNVAFNNLALFIFVDDTDAVANDFLEITTVSMFPSAKVKDFTARTYAEELALCQRFYQEPINLILANYSFTLGKATSTTHIFAFIDLQTEMRIAPMGTITAAANWAYFGSSYVNATGVALNAAGIDDARKRVFLDLTGSGLTANDAFLVGSGSGTPSAKITLDAEL
jgi:hypothetical protein